MIIGIAGTIGSGKGTVVDYLKSKGFGHYSSSAILKEILTERGLEHTRFNLSSLADELLAQQPGGVLAHSYARAKEAGEDDIVLEAIHRQSEAQYVRSVGGVILGVDANPHVRFERISKRKEGKKDEVTLVQFLADSKREDEGGGGTGSNIRPVIDAADAVIMNEGSLEELQHSIDAALAKLRSEPA